MHSISRKLKELDDLKRRKAQSTELARLEAEIQKLREEDQAAYSSVVDYPPSTFPPKPHNYALVLGVEKYKKLPDAQFAERDAGAVRRSLIALGVPEANLVYLVGQEATLAQIKGYLEEWLPKNVSKKSRVYFYFSGHGAPDPGSGDAYIVPWDGDASFLKSTGYPLEKLYSGLAALKSKEILVALDACFSGAGGRSVLAQGARPLVTKLDGAVPLAPKLTLLAAAQADEITGVLTKEGHGIFTYYLLKAIHEGPRQASTIFDALKPEVESEARKQNRLQTPVFRGPDISLP